MAVFQIDANIPCIRNVHDSCDAGGSQMAEYS